MYPAHQIQVELWRAICVFRPRLLRKPGRDGLASFRGCLAEQIDRTTDLYDRLIVGLVVHRRHVYMEWSELHHRHSVVDTRVRLLSTE